MAPLPLRTALVGITFALFACAPAEAARAREHRHAAAPTVVTVYGPYRMARPLYWGANRFPPGPLVYGNEYLGDDPDPFIRLQIWRDLGAHFEGGR